MTDTILLPQKSDIWWIFLLQGFAGIILGLVLVTEPGATVVVLTTVLGFYWLITGLLGLVQAFVDRSTPWMWSLLSGVLGILAGLFVLRHPLVAALTVPTVIVIVLGIQGVAMGALQIIGGFRAAVSDRSFSARLMFWSEYCFWARRSRPRWPCRSCSVCCCLFKARD